MGSTSQAPRRPALLALAALLPALALTAAAIAQSPGDQGAPILHQDLRPPDNPASVSGAPDRPPLFGSSPEEGSNPSAIGAGEKLLPRPSTAESPGAEEPVHGGKQFDVDRLTDWTPDYHTEEDGTLHYREVFNPSVVPFKRMTALDAVDEEYTLFTDSSALTDLPVGGRAGEGEDLFWGSLVLELETGEDVPIPSVSPDMRILSYEIEPSTRVTFSKDRADNYYVRSNEAGTSGQYRLVFLAAARQSYFAPRVPRDLWVKDVPSGQVRSLPPRVEAQASRVLRDLGVSRRTRLDIAVDKLVAYFRNFEARPPPPSSGDIYWDLYRSQAGVCRHRSFAFMITANALGLPTRYVANEAHAFVELWVPGEDWMRIDLGGAALRLRVSNAQDKSMYRPPAEDPFPKPPAYSENYTRLEGDVTGLSEEQKAEARTPREGEAGRAGDVDGDGAIEGEDGGDGAGERAESGGAESGGASEGAEEAAREEDRGSGVMTGPGEERPEIPPEELAGKTPTTLEVTGASSEGFRGEMISVEGHLADASGQGLAGQRIDIWLAPTGRGGDDAVLVGHTASLDDGSFAAQVVLPDDLPLRDYEVFASTPGDASYQPSVSE